MNVLDEPPENSSLGIAIVSDELTLFAETLAVFLRQTGRFSRVYTVPPATELAENPFPALPDGPVYLISDHRSIGLREVIPTRQRLFIILVSHIRNLPQFEEVLLLKPDGLINKTDSTDELLRCIATLREGRSYLSSSLARLLAARHDRSLRLDFTPKEREVLRHAQRGKNIAETAEALSLSRHTVITHRRNMMVKANCNSITELLSIAVSEGLISY